MPKLIHRKTDITVKFSNLPEKKIIDRTEKNKDRSNNYTSGVLIALVHC